MKLVLGVISMVSAGIIYLNKRNEKFKIDEGEMVLGTKLRCTQFAGRPTRYIVDIEFVENNIARKRKIITTDKNILKCKDNTPIMLLYLKGKNKVYWAEEKSCQNIVIRILLIVFCVFAFLLMFISFFIL